MKMNLYKTILANHNNNNNNMGNANFRNDSGFKIFVRETRVKQ